MAWLRLDDGFDNDPAIIGIARNRAEADRIVGILATLMLYCARHGTDGFVPELIVREHIRSTKMLQRLTDPPDGGTPLLHTRDGKDCECLSGREWRPGAMYYVHHYLQSNPTKDETDVQRAKQAELRDRELQRAVRDRDGARCRYCGRMCNLYDRRSGLGLVYDHVDPAVANGAANLVVSCKGCNSRKGNRTPEAAGMALQPMPIQTTDQNADPMETCDPTTDPITDPTTHAPVRDGTGRVNAARPETGSAGPNGERPPTGPPRGPARPSAHPDPYRRSAITGPDPDLNAGLPEVEP